VSFKFSDGTQVHNCVHSRHVCAALCSFVVCRACYYQEIMRMPRTGRLSLTGSKVYWF